MSSSTVLDQFEQAELEDLEDLIHGASILKLTIVLCTTIHFYYSVLHFDEEVEYIWARKWTVGKVIYLLTRYLGVFFLACATIGMSSIFFVVKYDMTFFGFFKSCLYGELFAGLGTMVMLLAEVILEMRVHALYGMKKKGLIFFVLLTLALFFTNILQFSSLLNDREESSCSRGVCPVISVGTGSCSSASTMSGIGWVVTSCVELLLFLLVVWKVFQLRKDRDIKSLSPQMPIGVPQNRDITALMAKDSIIYFAIIFTICLVGTALKFRTDRDIISGRFVNDPVRLDTRKQLLNAYQTIAITCMTILAPKLLINLRAEYYGPVGIIQTQLSWNAEVSRRSCRVLESFEGLGDEVQTSLSEGHDQLGSDDGSA